MHVWLRVLLWCGLAVRRSCSIQFDRDIANGRWVPGSRPTPGALLAGFEEVDLSIRYPFRTALEICAKKVAHTFGMLKTLNVD